MNIVRFHCEKCNSRIEYDKDSAKTVVCPSCGAIFALIDLLYGQRRVFESEKPALTIPELQLGNQGTYKKSLFFITGRARFKDQNDNFWDEWYVTFSNGWLGRLFFSGDALYITFKYDLSEDFQVKDFEKIRVGDLFDFGKNPKTLIVKEKGIAKYAAVEGAIPYDLVLDEEFKFVKSADKNGKVAVINIRDDKAELFSGYEFSLKSIKTEGQSERQINQRKIKTNNCVSCGSNLRIRLPHLSKRVVCQFCKSLLEINTDGTIFIETVSPLPNHDFTLKIGTFAAFKDIADTAEFEIIGAMLKKSANLLVEEYVLYNPQFGFRLLSKSDK